MHDALETIVSPAYSCSLTPFTRVFIGISQTPESFFSHLQGAETRTFFAPAIICLFTSELVLKNPVLSTTTSMPRSPHGRFSGSFSEKTLISFPLTISELPFASTVPGNFPWTESYLSRYASSFVSVRSFTATNSILESSNPARKTILPILPNPLIATLMPIINHLFIILVGFHYINFFI